MEDRKNERVIDKYGFVGVGEWRLEENSESGIEGCREEEPTSVSLTLRAKKGG